MSLPVVAILGRPNVGKSSLFNALVRSRVAIVDPTAGVTRDRVAMELRAGDRRCELVDTGGIGIVDDLGLEEDVEAQIAIAMHSADLILFVVDVQNGLLAPDRHIADRLRKLDKPILLVANKMDAPTLEPEMAPFFGLGMGDPFPVSATSGRGVGELREEIAARLPETPPAPDEDEVIRLAVVGSPNAGKSTLVNHLIGDDRMIVSEVPGTTRDAVDLAFERGGQHYVAVDTAGLRKKASVSGSPDFYAQARAEKAIRRSHVVLFLLDATRPIGRVERSIGERIQEACKPCVLVLTKWDLVPEDKTLQDFAEYVQATLPFLALAPMTCLSSVQGFHVEETLGLARELHHQAGQRLGTGELNRLIKAAMEYKGPPSKGGRTGKILFATQVDVHPPTILLFVNEAKALTADYRRYLANFLRERGPYQEVPIRLWLRQREDRRRGR